MFDRVSVLPRLFYGKARSEVGKLSRGRVRLPKQPIQCRTRLPSSPREQSPGSSSYLCLPGKYGYTFSWFSLLHCTSGPHILRLTRLILLSPWLASSKKVQKTFCPSSPTTWSSCQRYELRSLVQRREVSRTPTTMSCSHTSSRPLWKPTPT
jgi:hypothetical protein